MSAYLAALDDLAATKGRRPDPERLQGLFDLVWRHAMEERPDVATFVGWPGLDDRLPDLSLEAVARRRAEAGAPLRALATINRDTLEPGDQLSYDVFSWEQRSEAEAARFPAEHLPLSQLEGPQTDLGLLLGSMPTSTPAHLGNLVARLGAVPLLVEQTIALLDQGRARGVTPPQVTLRSVPAQVEAHLVDDPAASPLLAPFRQATPSLPPADMAGARREAQALVAAEVVPAFRRLHDYLVATYLPAARTTTALADLPEGREWYEERVRHHTTTELTPQEVHEIGLAEVARISSELERARQAAGHRGAAEDFAHHLRSDPRFFFDRPETLLAAYRDIAKRIDPAVVRLFRRLPRLPFGVEPVPAEMAASAPAAFYLEGSLEGGRPGRFFVNTSALASRPTWNMESLCLHEAVPGHHFQISLAQELEEVPEFRRRGMFTAYIEGWGLYSERLGHELGMYQDPYQRFGALDTEMLRAVRLVVDTGMHALGWSREQAIEYFGRHSASPHHDVVVEIDRYLVLPGQALAYKLGELKLRELRAEAADHLGERFDVRDFHDVVLRDGALPLGVLEAQVRRWADSMS
ncbi:MAG TPA: DUF885 domain-containing protein [Acidimicrobiales bacterium]|nr:DUF885 domain-containing protein [Acidimicrobiales bacterium]